ncbi:hypothetical protein GCM10007079_25170 [Nocardiopsis terrae]|nr:hypothetical protein GCM10007079_25170 [Nocardiopsis terrae]
MPARGVRAPGSRRGRSANGRIGPADLIGSGQLGVGPAMRNARNRERGALFFAADEWRALLGVARGGLRCTSRCVLTGGKLSETARVPRSLPGKRGLPVPRVTPRGCSG